MHTQLGYDLVTYLSDRHRSQDRIFDPTKLIPPRPTISNFQWISGSQYITPTDLDLLISGPDRPPSKRMLAQARNDEAARRSEALSSRTASAETRAAAQSSETWAAYMQRQVTERTQNISLMGDRMESLETNSAGWADDVNQFVSRQKKNLIMGAVKHKFGF